MDGVVEQFRRAVTRLAQDGHVKDRLAEAWAQDLAAIPVEHLPDPCRAEYAELAGIMCRERPLARESAVRATVRKMSAVEAARCAARIVALFGSVACELPRLPHHRTPSSAAQVVVPLFAAEA